MSCGCGEPHEGHGDRRNIVYADLKKAGRLDDLGQRSGEKYREDVADQEPSLTCGQMMTPVIVGRYLPEAFASWYSRAANSQERRGNKELNEELNEPTRVTPRVMARGGDFGEAERVGAEAVAIADKTDWLTLQGSHA